MTGVFKNVKQVTIEATEEEWYNFFSSLPITPDWTKEEWRDKFYTWKENKK